jgi:hypothetical protein
MNYLKNHCWCSDSNWGGHYDCTIIVGLSSYDDGYEQDWASLIDVDSELYDDPERYETVKEFIETNGGTFDKTTFLTKVNNLKPEVLNWLESEVPDLAVDKYGNGHKKAWAIGSTAYRSRDSKISFSIFFQRRRDAMAFIKRWSVWGKPINYCQYFTDVRKRLNLETKKYEKR